MLGIQFGRSMLRRTTAFYLRQFSVCSECSRCISKELSSPSSRMLMRADDSHKVSWSVIRRTLASQSKKNQERKGPVTWKSLLITLGLGGVLLAGFKYAQKQKELELEKERNRSLGKAAIGGPFSLVDHDGNPKSNEDYLGKWVLLYFGFTHCPDICPDELEKMIAAVKKVNASPNLMEVVPLFITIDPERDTPAVIKEYVNEFFEGLIGLTGTTKQVNEVAKSFRVYHSQGPKDDDNDYIVDHTIIMYLMSPEGDFMDYYGQNKTDEEIAGGIASHIRKYKKLNGL